jgi:hypothetical protein
MMTPAKIPNDPSNELALQLEADGKLAQIPTMMKNLTVYHHVEDNHSLQGEEAM